MPREVFISADLTGRGVVKIDGVDISKYVQATTVRTEVMEVTKVELELIPEMVTVDLEAMLSVEFDEKRRREGPKGPNEWTDYC